MKCNIAGNHYLLVGQPNGDFARAVRGSEVQEFDAPIAQLDEFALGEGLVGVSFAIYYIITGISGS